MGAIQIALYEVVGGYGAFLRQLQAHPQLERWCPRWDFGVHFQKPPNSSLEVTGYGGDVITRLVGLCKRSGKLGEAQFESLEPSNPTGRQEKQLRSSGVDGRYRRSALPDRCG